MAGFNSRNILSGYSPTIGFSIGATSPSPVFRLLFLDVDGMAIQINSTADPGALTVESSLDGGTTWFTITSHTLTAFSGGISRFRIDPADLARSGPLMRLKTANTVTATAIWVTTRG